MERAANRSSSPPLSSNNPIPPLLLVVVVVAGAVFTVDVITGCDTTLESSAVSPAASLSSLPNEDYARKLTQPCLAQYICKYIHTYHVYA